MKRRNILEYHCVVLKDFIGKNKHKDREMRIWLIFRSVVCADSKSHRVSDNDLEYFSQRYFKSLNKKKNAPIPILVSSLPKSTQLPKTKQKKLKSYKGNLKYFNLSTQISTWMALDRASDTFWG